MGALKGNPNDSATRMVGTKVTPASRAGWNRPTTRFGDSQDRVRIVRSLALPTGDPIHLLGALGKGAGRRLVQWPPRSLKSFSSPDRFGAVDTLTTSGPRLGANARDTQTGP